VIVGPKSNGKQAPPISRLAKHSRKRETNANVGSSSSEIDVTLLITRPALLLPRGKVNLHCFQTGAGVSTEQRFRCEHVTSASTLG